VPLPEVETSPAVRLIANDAPVCLCDNDHFLFKKYPSIYREKKRSKPNPSQNYFYRHREKKTPPHSVQMTGREIYQTSSLYPYNGRNVNFAKLFRGFTKNIFSGFGRQLKTGVRGKLPRK